MFKIIPFLVCLACLSTFTKGDFEPLKWVYDNDQNGDSYIKRTAEKTWMLVEDGETIGEYNEESFRLDENGLPVVILWQFIDENQTDMIFLLVKEGEALFGNSKNSINEFFVKGKWEVTNSPDFPLNNPERICTNTCTKNGLNWNGAWMAVESEKINSCECRDTKEPRLKSTPRSSSITMAKCVEIFCARMHGLQNELRRRHQANNLATNLSLSRASQNYAVNMSRSLNFDHDSNRGNVGENLAFIMRSPRPVITETFCRKDLAERMTNMWYNEINDYDFRTGQAKQRGKVIGHFTQMVWKNSASFGCGLARDSTGQRFYAVGRYSPPGNFRGQFVNNVLPQR